jgi:hypothetical protein
VTAEPTPPRDDEDAKLDEALEESFPASDPPATWARRDEDDEDESRDDDRRA